MITRWRAEIAQMLDERFYPLRWVEAEIAAGRIETLQNDKAIIGVQLRTYPGGAVELHGMFACGDKAAISELVDHVLALAEAEGCTCAAIESRPGWAREFRAKGFNVDRVRIVKEFSHGD
jgi:hypothetical protein